MQQSATENIQTSNGENKMQHDAESSLTQPMVARVKLLTYMMFFVFAMTSDAVGVIIPELIKDYGLSMTQASAFHYVPMLFIGLSGLFLGYLADKLGRKITICIGLLLFSLASFSFAMVEQFGAFVLLLSLVGMGVGIFKTGALALIGDVSDSSKQHTSTMNKAEGFFGVGAMIGPAVVSFLLISGVSWKYLYIIAGALCLTLCLIALTSKYPQVKKDSNEAINLKQTLAMVKNKYALGFSSAIALYVAVEVAIYVWMPSLFVDYQGSYIWLSTYAITVFFALRAGGRFLGAWMLNHFAWQSVLVVSTLFVALSFLASVIFGVDAAIWALPISGLFMSVIYPTLNSKAISCFPKQQHGAVAGVTLFFTALSAAIAPLLMGLTSDIFGHVYYGFYLATLFAVLLVLITLWNWRYDPASSVIEKNSN